MVDIIVTPNAADRTKQDQPLVDLTHRMACEAANLARISKFHEATTRQPDLTGWRAWMSDETRAAVDLLEASGHWRFVHEDEVKDA